MEGNLAALLALRAETYGWRDRVLFHTGDGATFSHGTVHDAAARASGVLHMAGIRTGHRVLIALPDSIGFVAALLGTLRLGAVAVLADPELPPVEHAYLLVDSDPAMVVCEPGGAGRFASVPVLTPEDLTDEPATIPEAVSLPPDAPAYVQYTAGTTGRRKGAVHRHTDAESYFQALGLGALGIVPGDVLFSTVKACRPYGLGNTVFFPMFCGASAILSPGWSPVTGAVDLARRHRPTLLFGTPGFYTRLAAEGDRKAFASLRAATSTGGPLTPAQADRAAEFLGCPVLDGLCTAEVGHTFISNTVSRSRRGTLGVVLHPYETRVGGDGELRVRGPSVMIEYLDRPGETARVLDRGGWLRTGDRVRVDADGFVHHRGRAQA